MLLALPVLSGCGKEKIRQIRVTGADTVFDLTPCKQANGEPFHIGVMDLIPPIESSYLWLKGLAEGLQESGYIAADVDLASAPEGFEEYYAYLLEQDLGEYVAFDDEYYLVGTDDDEALGERLREKVKAGELQIIAATGTDPGLFLKDLDLGIPFLVSFATAPIASGIIESEYDTGNENIWALVEPNPLYRQFGAYHTMFGFEKVGMVVVEEYDLIGGYPEYRRKAEELGVELRELTVTEEEVLSENYNEILIEKLEGFDMSDLDALVLAFGSVDDPQMPVVEKYLAEKKMPSLIVDGDSLVKNGGLICLSCYDYEGYGKYVSMIMSNIFHGQKAGDQPCRYISAPHIVLNMDTAKDIGFETNWELLRSVDIIYSRDSSIQ